MLSPDELQVDLYRKLAREAAESNEGVDKALDRFSRLASSYPQLSVFNFATRKNLIDVAEYLFCWWSGYWEPIVKGGVLAFGLFLHELTERRWYESHGFNPFAYADQTTHYPESHSKALIAEHRFLAAVARIEGLDFSLRQLIEANPWGDSGSDQWEGDWAVVTRVRGHELKDADFRVQKDQSANLQRFLKRLQSANAIAASERTVSLPRATGWTALTTFLLSAATLL